MNKLIPFASAIFVAFVVAGPSQADDTPRTRTVRFADLDLDKTEGAATLFSRIRAAARSVCDEHRSRELIRQQRYIACIDLAVANAVARVDEPTLTEYYANRTSRPSSAPRVASRH
ncbi:MAG: UrcA family protein [Xanthomonadaceae bacterium]|nr:UrcA family protein [Xanthomonadaceae bacterium]